MKKTYINPDIAVTAIKLESLLTTVSNPLFDKDGETSTMDSRRHSVFFDDEED